MPHSTRTISSLSLELEAARQEGRTIVRLLDERDAEVEKRLRALERRRHRQSLLWLLGLPALLLATSLITLSVQNSLGAPQHQQARTAAR